MSKSMYSLILSDQVIREVDRLAYTKGTSRSGLINQILAEHFVLTTPEQRIRHVFDSIAALVQDATMQVPEQPDNTVLQVRSVLQYKYNPTIRYSVELFPNGREGLFRVSARTQNMVLTQELSMFYQIWNSVETAVFEKQRIPLPEVEIIQGRYLRRLRLDRVSHLEPEELGKGIAVYIQIFDGGLDLFLNRVQGAEKALINDLLLRYKQLLQDTGLLL